MCGKRSYAARWRPDRDLSLGLSAGVFVPSLPEQIARVPDRLAERTPAAIPLSLPEPVLIGTAVLGLLLLLLLIFLGWWHKVRLRRAEARWRSLYRALPGAQCILNEAGLIEDASETLCRLTEYAREELLNRPGQMLGLDPPLGSSPPEGEESAENLEGKIRVRSGREIPVRYTFRRIGMENRRVTLVSFQDDSARKEAEEALRKSEETERESREKLTALHEIIMDLTTQRDWEGLCRRTVELAHERLGFDRIGIWFKSDDPNIVYGSYGIDEFGVLRDERGNQLSVAGDPVVREALQETVPRTYYHPCRCLFNHRGKPIGKGPVVMATLWNGHEVIGYLSADSFLTGREISPVQQQVLTLLASTLANLITGVNTERERVRLASAIEQASEAVVITGGDGMVEYINQGLTKMLGYEDRDVLDHNMSLFYDHRNEPEALEEMHRAMGEGRGWVKRMVVRGKDGRTLEAEVNLSPVRDDEGNITHFVHILRDVSKEAQLEAQLRQAAKMEAIGRLAGGIAHDFNNQLTVVRGYCDLLLRDLDAASPIRECIEQIEHATRQATTLTSELLSFSRKQILKPQVVNPNRILENIRKSLGLVGEDIRLHLDLREDVGNIRVDPNRLEQAIMNLAINARDAMPDGGDLTIRTANMDYAEELFDPRTLQPIGPMVMIEVRDTGVGMDAETLEQIFEPFFSTKKKGKGTGLGLSMVYGFVQQSDGYIRVESQPGRGTAFRMYLPRVSEPLDAETPQVESAPAVGGNETILVVEDDSTVRQLVVRVLREHGYDVRETGVPEQAAPLLETGGCAVDLLITDVVMPGISGPALAQTLREKRPELRVLFISGFTDEKTLRREIHLAKVNFLQKPFSPEDLCRAVTRALRGQET